ncbi:MAG: hypothetical protein R3195_11040 [Gemmatimonadota bacterium]|nr:hypothetical protein [Gemmatimonadota bacterium]
MISRTPPRPLRRARAFGLAALATLPATVSADATVPVHPLAAPEARDRPARQAASCADTPGFSTLDFWVGEWDVLVGEEVVGANTIEKILDGCAVMEHWVDATGAEGKSLFFYHPVTDTWKQVWVTESATQVGGLKEKTLIATFDDGGVRFQGEIPTPDVGSILDRTTLTPNPDGTVRQLIEISRDGESWQTSFDAVYRRRE